MKACTWWPATATWWRFLDPEFKTDTEDWREGRAFELGQKFLYKNRIPADRMLFAARLMTILLSLTLGLVLAAWTRAKFGAWAGILALVFFAFDPNILAHGRYITSDVCVTLFSFGACIAWGAYLVKGGTGRLVLAGVVLGLAMISKFSSAFLLPVFLLLAVLRFAQQGRVFGWKRLAGSFLLVWVLAGVVVVAAYPGEASMLIPKTHRQLEEGGQPPLAIFVSPATAVGRGLIWLGHSLGLRPHSYLLGLGMVAEHNAVGHPSYLMGEVFPTGHWSYFPIAFAVKTPLGTLAALALVLGLGVFCLVRAGTRLFRQWRGVDFTWLVVTVPPLVYLAFTMAGSINIGVRHLLPVYPFLFAALGGGLVRFPWKRRGLLIAALAAAVMVESLAVYPYYLAFFNRAVGGPANGSKYLVDSNIDWGQDLKRLKRYLDEHKLEKVCIRYFGSAPPRYYGIEEQYLPSGDQWQERSEMICPVAAVSVTPLMGVYVPPEQLAWLRGRTPVDKVGYSINIYAISEADKRR
ncbi:MAG: glycosyltransferase family 39 protein [Acidobacteria bacterium]|nr:glycosyltransferase family 39 protein [Acidobacteriota bacterium]